MANINEALYSVQKQYFQAVGMRHFDWGKLESSSESDIEQITVLNATVLHRLSQKYPASNTYKLSFLKSLLAVSEKQNRDVCDELYSLIANLMAEKKSVSDDFVYKSYILPCGQPITLCESAQFVSQGTTGLNTWQAGMYLSNWLIENTSVLKGMNILELGCGVGLTGLVALHCSRPKTYTFTDCHETVLSKVRQNLQINNFSTCEQTQDRRVPCFEERTGISENFEFKSLSFSQNVQECRTCSMCKTGVLTEQCCASVCQLDWETCTTEETERYNPDVILASDVIFDPRIIEALVNVMKILLSRKVKDKDQKCQPVAYIASTIRNSETYEKFLNTLDKSGIKKNEIHSAPENFILYDMTSEIVLLQLVL